MWMISMKAMTIYEKWKKLIELLRKINTTRKQCTRPLLKREIIYNRQQHSHQFPIKIGTWGIKSEGTKVKKTMDYKVKVTNEVR